MGYRFPDGAAMWQLLSAVLFVAGAGGAIFAEAKIHRMVVRREGPAQPNSRRRELQALILVCLLFTLLIAAAMLLPIAVGLGEPGGMSTARRFGPQAGKFLLAAWLVNGAYCAWATLRFTREIDDDRLRYGTAAAIALTNLTAGLHSYFWMIAPGTLPQFVGPRAAIVILAALGFACLLPAHVVAGSPHEGPLFNWEHIRVRTFGWIILLLNGMVFLLWHVASLRVTKQFLPDSLELALPFVVNALLVFPYLQLKDSTSGSRRMTSLMLLFLGIQVIIFAAVIGFVPREPRNRPTTEPATSPAASRVQRHPFEAAQFCSTDGNRSGYSITRLSRWITSS